MGQTWKNAMTDNSHEQDYGKRVITVDVLKTWIPIMLTVGSLTIAVGSTLTGMIVTNSGRLSRLEVQVEQIRDDQKETKASQKETIQLLQRLYLQERDINNGDRPRSN